MLPTHFSSTFQGHFPNVHPLMAGLKRTPTGTQRLHFITLIYNILQSKPLKLCFLKAKSLEITGEHKVLYKKGKPLCLLQG